jgi:hypothetical protein
MTVACYTTLKLNVENLGIYTSTSEQLASSREPIHKISVCGIQLKNRY